MNLYWSLMEDERQLTEYVGLASPPIIRGDKVTTFFPYMQTKRHFRVFFYLKNRPLRCLTASLSDRFAVRLLRCESPMNHL